MGRTPAVLREPLALGFVRASFVHGRAAAVGTPPSRPCSNSLLWFAGGGIEAVNGRTGKKLGANRIKPSPKHRSGACKALLYENFLRLCHSLPREALTTAAASASVLNADGASRQYHEVKLMAILYQNNKALFLNAPSFRAWAHASALGCDAFVACYGL